MPESGQGRWCRRYGSDIDEQTYGGCTLGQATPLRQKQEFVANLSRIFPDQCSGFGTHYDFSLLSTLGVDFRRTLTLTVLRNPVDLVISLYYFYSLPYWREAGFYDCDHAGAMALFRSDDTVSEPGFAGLLRFASIPHLVANRQAYQLAGALECTPGGANPWSMSEAEALARAKHNLSRLCLVLIQARLGLAAGNGWVRKQMREADCRAQGVGSACAPQSHPTPFQLTPPTSAQEHMEESLQQLRGFMGWADGVVNTSIHENINPHPVVPPDVRQRLEQMNALDMELYRYAVRLFKQRSRAGSSRASRRAQ